MTPWQIQRAARWYRENLAWTVTTTDDDVVLPLTLGTVAFALPSRHADRVLRGLDLSGASTPALITADETELAVFLADANDAVFGQADLPGEVRYLTAPRVVPLPVGEPVRRAARRWLRPLRADARWMCSATTLLRVLVTELGQRAPG